MYIYSPAPDTAQFPWQTGYNYGKLSRQNASIGLWVDAERSGRQIISTASYARFVIMSKSGTTSSEIQFERNWSLILSIGPTAESFMTFDIFARGTNSPAPKIHSTMKEIATMIVGTSAARKRPSGDTPSGK